MTSALANNLHRHSELYWAGEVTIERIAVLRDELLAALLSSRSVAIDLGDVTALDLSALQLLCATQRAAVPLGKELLLPERDLPLVRAVLRRFGFERLAPCCRECGPGCLWLARPPVAGEDQ